MDSKISSEKIDMLSNGRSVNYQTDLAEFQQQTTSPPKPALVSAPSGAVLCGKQFSQGTLAIAGFVVIFTVGLVLGLALEPPSVDPKPWNRISAVVGWWYFTAWSVSFLPQIYLNYVRKCVGGQSFNYVALNMVGFSCLALYTVSFYFVPSIREQYRKRFGNENNVDLNDVGFGVLASVLTAYNVWQIKVYDRSGQSYARSILVAIAITCIVFVLWVGLLLLGVRATVVFNTLDLLYGMSLVKLVVTLIKYIPQIHLNYKRQMTVGWNIWNVLLDFSGGSLSVLQLFIDCASTGRWNGIVGNPVKFGLGLLSIVYDTVFMVQHYCLYRENNRIQHEKDDAVRAAIAKGKEANL